MSKAWLNFVFVGLACASAIGQNNFKVLHSFSGYPNDGAASISAVAFGNNGNLYGTTAGGGNGYGCGDNGCGSVFELSPQQDGSWKETVIHNFCTDFDGQACLDGAYPYAGLLADSKGNLYGTTVNGGPSCPPWGFIGCGVLFELSPPAIPGDSWTEAVLYDFCSVVQGIGCLDGELPTGQLIFDPAGNLYGTTTGGGSGHLAGGGGTVFELSPDAGRWKEAILYDFCSLGSGEICPDGYDVTAGVTFDAEGNLYGTTTYSGNGQSPTGGTIYELARLGSVWKYRELLDVPANSKRSVFYGNISFDSLGDLYSTFSFVYGGVFRMSLGDHKLTILDFNGADGENPVGGVYVNSNKGVLYGTTTGGGGANPGNFFEIARDGKETVLHTFCSWTDCEDGELPRPTPVPDKSSNLYGTTQFGGTYGNGVVFEVTP
jgi:uncharacterized repeat protein (TIGR03803 family)